MNNWDSICRTLGIDDAGNVYGSFGAGRIYQYDPRTDKIRELPSHLPVREKGISFGRDYDKSETAWRTVVWDVETKKFYGVEESATTLFSFDPAASPDTQVRTLGELSIPEFTGRRDVPYATLSMTLGLNRKLYYAAAGAEFDYVSSVGVAASHLMTYDLRNGRIEDLGEMRLPDGRAVLGTNAADTGPDGTIYFVGAVSIKADETASGYGGSIQGTPYRLALFILHPNAS